MLSTGAKNKAFLMRAFVFNATMGLIFYSWFPYLSSELKNLLNRCRIG